MTRNNIFCKTPITTSSDYINRKKSITLINNVAKDENTVFSKNFIKCNNRLINIKSYDFFVAKAWNLRENMEKLHNSRTRDAHTIIQLTHRRGLQIIHNIYKIVCILEASYRI